MFQAHLSTRLPPNRPNHVLLPVYFGLFGWVGMVAIIGWWTAAIVPRWAFTAFVGSETLGTFSLAELMIGINVLWAAYVLVAHWTLWVAFKRVSLNHVLGAVAILAALLATHSMLTNMREGSQTGLHVPANYPQYVRVGFEHGVVQLPRDDRGNPVIFCPLDQMVIRPDVRAELNRLGIHSITKLRPRPESPKDSFSRVYILEYYPTEKFLAPWWRTYKSAPDMYIRGACPAPTPYR